MLGWGEHKDNFTFYLFYQVVSDTLCPVMMKSEEGYATDSDSDSSVDIQQT
jgi:hypothetical protein